ncbi:MAG: chromate reductase [Desulforhopalus sp.]|jgi:chromate reductase
MVKLKVLGICGSLRRESTNFGLLKYAKENAPADLEIKLADLADVPFYNADLLTVPRPAQKLMDDIAQADALLLACPEYNYSMAPVLKNALDWASRAPENHLLAGKPSAILDAGGGMGTTRAQYHLRQVCVFLDIHLLNKPEVFSNAFDGSFDNEGNLINEKIQKLVVEQLTALRRWSKILRIYPKEELENL